MDFIDRLRELSAQVSKLAEHIEGNEEATKNALVMPLISAFGYNVFDPTEVIPEYTADVGTKRGEKVDYAIQKDGNPIILFECKSYGSNLNNTHASQLYRYFTVTEARFGILTNGVVYRFYSDLDSPNRMDEKPFLVFDLTDFTESQVEELKKFTKASFDVENIVSTASELKYTREIKRIIASELSDPSEDFIRLFASQVYSGRMTQSVKDMFLDITKRAFQQVINDKINDRLKSALTRIDDTPKTSEELEPSDKEVENIEEVTPGKKIVTTPEEIEGFFAVKSILRTTIDLKRVAMRDTQSYCNVLLDDTRLKPICRLHFNRSQKYLGVFDADKNETRIPIDDVDDIYQYAEQLKVTVANYEQG